MTTTATAAADSQGRIDTWIRNAAEMGVFFKKLTVPLATAQLALNEITACYTFDRSDKLVLGLAGYITDVDTNGTPAHEFKITVGSTDILTAQDAGQAGGGFAAAVFLGGTPGVSKGDQILFTTTTAAATAAAGTLTLYLAEVIKPRSIPES